MRGLPLAGDSRALKGVAGDFSGAFADLGTFLPLVIGMFAVQRLDPAGVLVGFGLFAVATAAIYRRPIPIQPMKVVAGVVIAGGLGAQEIAATGVLLGAVLIVLVLSGALGALARRVPETVLAGVRLGVGLYLAWAGVGLIGVDWIEGLVALASLLVLQYTPLRHLSGVLIIGVATVQAVASGDAELPALTLGVYLPQPLWPGATDFSAAAQSVLLPQLALTLTNASLVTAAIAADLFPGDKERITAGRLALSTGVLNLVLAPIGAFPMCHGAGGLVVQHRFGARTGLAPLLFGMSCLVLGLLLGAGALDLLAIVPMAAVGALLVLAGAELAGGRHLRTAKGGVLAVVLATGALCVAANVAVGFVVGLALELLRVSVERRTGGE